MRFWWRELGGWLLIGLGLLGFALAWDFCRNRWIFEAWPTTLIAIVVFWGGIHLLKVALAARICQQAQDRLYPAGASDSKPVRTASPRSSAARRSTG